MHVLLLHTECKRRRRAERLSRFQLGRRERRFIGTIGIMLRLETKSTPVIVFLSCFDGIGAFHKIPAIELHARLIRPDRQDDPALVSLYDGRQP